MRFGFPIPGWGVLAVVLLTLAISAFAYVRPPVPLSWSRRATLATLRFATLWTVVFLLLQPVRTEPAPPTDTLVPIVIDSSRSMGIADVDGPTRVDQAIALATNDLEPTLAEFYTVERYTFGEDLTAVPPGPLTARAPHSDLGSALDQLREHLVDRTVGAVIVISDGGLGP